MNLVSIVIPILVIVLAVITRKIITSLFLGVFLGGIFLSNGNVLKGLMTGVEYVVKSLSKEDSVYIILFLFLFGSLAEIIKMSGGIKGFVKLAENHVKSERGALGSVWAVTPVTFIDCCFHAISAGTIAKSLTDKINGNKLRLAHVLNVTSCLLIILIPFGTTYVGYIVGVISSSMSNTGIQVSPYKIYLQSIPFNFYAIIMVLFSIVVTVAPFGFNRKYNINALDNESEHEAHEQCTFEEKAPPRPLNLILPLAVLITSTIFFLWYTGRDNTGTFFKAILNANFEKSILFSAVLTILFTSLFYLFQKIPLNEIESHFMIGGNEMIPPIIILILSWGLSANLRIKIQFSTLGYANHYEAIKATVINRTDGPVDSAVFRFSDVLGKKQVSNPNFSNGIMPYAWACDGKTEWYVYKPTEQDYKQLGAAVSDYCDIFQTQRMADHGMQMSQQF